MCTIRGGSKDAGFRASGLGYIVNLDHSVWLFSWVWCDCLGNDDSH